MELAITSKGQATLPKAIREHLGLKPGDRVKFFVHPDGSVVILLKFPVSALRGVVPAPARPVTVDEMTRSSRRARSRSDSLPSGVIGLDVNVLVRHVAQDDPVQSPKAMHLIERVLTEQAPGFISTWRWPRSSGFCAALTA